MLVITFNLCSYWIFYKEKFLAIFTGVNQKEIHGWMLFGHVHSFPFVVSVPIGCGCCRLLTRAGLMSLVVISSGNLRVFVLLEDQALFRVAEFAAKLCVDY